MQQCHVTDPLALWFAEAASYLHEQCRMTLPAPYTLCSGAGHSLYWECRIARVPTWLTPSDRRRVVDAGVCP
jgi:hypothetical protein